MELVKCKLCGQEYKSITHTHVSKVHGITLKEYIQKYPNAPIHFEQIQSGKKLLLDAVNRTFK